MTRAGYDPSAAVDLQETFVRLSEEQAENWLSGLLASHPPSRERVQKNRRQVAALPPGGERNREAYDAAMAGLREAQPAYAKLSRGYESLEQNDASTALRLAEEAIAIEPRESLFYLLAAKARADRQEYPRALEYLDQAIGHNSRYFDHYLQRGLIRRQLGQSEPARKDLSLSAKLLPTGQANAALGILALEQGERDQAINFFSLAANTDSPAGQQAQLLLTRLDLPLHPERYLQIGVQLDPGGYLVLSASNRSVIPIRDLVVNIEVYRPTGGMATRTGATFHRIIPSGQTGYSTTRIGPFASVGQLAKTVRIGIASVAAAE